MYMTIMNFKKLFIKLYFNEQNELLVEDDKIKLLVMK